MSTSYAQRMPDLGRGLWLGDPMSQSLLGWWGAHLDGVQQLGFLGLLYTRPDQCPDDGVDAHAYTSALPRVRNETTQQLRAVIRSRFLRYQKMGSQDGLYEQLSRMGFAGCKWVSYVDLYRAGITTAFGGNSGFGYLDIDTPNGFGMPVLWDGGGLWDGGALWDITEPYAGAIEDLKAAVRRWKPVGVSCRFFRIRIGSKWVVVPVGEAWEFDANGNATDYYLTHW